MHWAWGYRHMSLHHDLETNILIAERSKIGEDIPLETKLVRNQNRLKKGQQKRRKEEKKLTVRQKTGRERSLEKEKRKKKKKRKKKWVVLYRPGCWVPSIHKRYPATVPCGRFCLLCFHPGPVPCSSKTWTPLAHQCCPYPHRT